MLAQWTRKDSLTGGQLAAADGTTRRGPEGPDKEHLQFGGGA